MRFKLSEKFGFWNFISIAISILLLFPIAIIFYQLLSPAGENWQHVAQYNLPDYLSNTLFLLAGVGFSTAIIGVGTAWLVTQYDFFGKKQFEWLLVMPMAVPTYIMAYSYTGISSSIAHAGNIPFDIRNMAGLIFILSFLLYPYVYLVCKASFSLQNASALEASRTMGKGAWQTFYKIALPLSRPAIAGGVSLVMMELLNDYGAVKHFGVDTVTSGIFRTWFSMGDMNTAIRICAIALVMILVFLVAEKIQRGKSSVYESAKIHQRKMLKKATLWKSLLFFLCCGIPVLLGFLLPVFQVIYWTAITAVDVWNMKFAEALFNTFSVGLLAAFLCVFVAVLFTFSKNWSPNIINNIFTKLSTTGYAVPGAVIAIGVLVAALYIDKNITPYIGLEYGYFVNYSIIFLVFAYTVRFIALPNNALDAGFKKLSPQVTAASRTMGKNSFSTLFKVHLPMVKNALAVAFLLAFVEVIKELPLTLILRPFDYNTLATRCFELAGDERIAESANYALVIIFSGMIPIFLLNRILRR